MENVYPHNINIRPVRNGFIVNFPWQHNATFVYQNVNVMLTHLRKLLKDSTLIDTHPAASELSKTQGPITSLNYTAYGNSVHTQEMPLCPSDVDPYP